MRERAAPVVDALSWSGTFHAMGARLLREYAEGIGIDRNFTINDRGSEPRISGFVTTTMACAHLIHGYIGAGKTTFARDLERNLSAIRFTHDEWMAALYGNDPSPDLFAENARRVTGVIWTIWPRCLELGLDVILDLNFWSCAQRDEARRTTTRNGGHYRLYRLHCSEETAWARVCERNNYSKRDLYIARNTFELLKSQYELLESDEEHVAIAT